MTVSGVDSAYAPSLAQAQAIRAQGHVFHGCYLSGSGAYNIWSPAQVAVLRAAGLSPLPICVPVQSGSENPTSVATAMVAACRAAGILSGGVVLDREHGSTFTQAWVDQWAAVVESYGYVPVDYCGPHNPMLAHWWNPAFGTPPAGCAYQTGSGSIAGLSVDLDVADISFPFGSWNPVDPPAPPDPPNPSPFTPEEESTMFAVPLPNGEVAIYAIGAGDREGDLLEFTRKPGDVQGSSNSVLDITDQIGGPDPYKVSG